MNRTREELQKALKDIVNTKKIESGVSEAKGISNKIPDSDISPGVRDAVLILINPAMPNGFTHQIKFLESNTTTYARINNELGMSWAPEGKWKNNKFYPTEDVIITAEMILDMGKWQIKGVADREALYEPGTTIVNRGDSVVRVHDDYTTVTNQNLVFKVDKDWAYINGLRICVEPCGSEPWIPVGDTIVVWYPGNFRTWVFDNGGEWVNDKDIENPARFWPELGDGEPEYDYEEDWAYTQTTGNYGTMNRDTGELATIQTANNYVGTAFVPKPIYELGVYFRKNPIIILEDGKQVLDLPSPEPILRGTILNGDRWTKPMDTLVGIGYARERSYPYTEEFFLSYGIDEGKNILCAQRVAVTHQGLRGMITVPDCEYAFELSGAPVGPIFEYYSEATDTLKIFIALDEGAVDVFYFKNGSFTQETTMIFPSNIKDFSPTEWFEWPNDTTTIRYEVLVNSGWTKIEWNPETETLGPSTVLDSQGIEWIGWRTFGGGYTPNMFLQTDKITLLGIFYGGLGDEGRVILLPQQNPLGAEMGIEIRPM